MKLGRLGYQKYCFSVPSEYSTAGAVFCNHAPRENKSCLDKVNYRCSKKKYLFLPRIFLAKIDSASGATFRKLSSNSFSSALRTPRPSVFGHTLPSRTVKAARISESDNPNHCLLVVVLIMKPDPVSGPIFGSTESGISSLGPQVMSDSMADIRENTIQENGIHSNGESKRIPTETPKFSGAEAFSDSSGKSKPCGVREKSHISLLLENTNKEESVKTEVKIENGGNASNSSIDSSNDLGNIPPVSLPPPNARESKPDPFRSPLKSQKDLFPESLKREIESCALVPSGQESEDSPEKHTIPTQIPEDFLNPSKGLRYLKKKDGEPFWRKDIQFEFLECLFSDDHKVFTNYFSWCEVPNAANSPKLTFAELYVRTMAESLKSSKVLRERLIKDLEMGTNVGKVCLLVNAGRINTTVNLLPDMRSAFRTFHLIPLLQCDSDGPRKPLQDTPRLKSILKAVCDGQEHFQSLLDVIRSPSPSKPNSNVIKLVFLLSSFFQNIPTRFEDFSIAHPFDEQVKLESLSTGPQNKFMEFFLNEKVSPRNRAKRFLWLMYTYLETSFTHEELAKNPFNPSVIPEIEYLSDEEVRNCDIDSEAEIDYAKKMYQIRFSIVGRETPTNTPRKGSKSFRERLQVKRQLSGDQSIKSGSEIAEDDFADDITLIEDETATDEQETGENGSRQDCVQRLVPDKSKRKRPTPSVGSLIEFSKKSVSLDGKWKNPQFPIESKETLKARFSILTPSEYVKQLSERCSLSISRRKYVALKTRLPVTQIAGLVPDFDSKRDTLMMQIYRVFCYKKGTKAGLLGIEWEDIRSDVINGIETYLYQQLGKDFLLQMQNEIVEEDKLSGLEVETLRKGFVSSSLNLDVGDLVTRELANQKPGEGYLPHHDYNLFNERLVHDYMIIEILSAVLHKNIQLQTVGSEFCSFDLNAGTLDFV